MDYSSLTDDVLIEKAQNNDVLATEELIKRYKFVSYSVARSFYLTTGDNDDLIQEGFFGTLNAIKTYNGKSSLKNYIYNCAKRRMLSLIRKENSIKNLPFLNYLSLSGSDDVDADKTDIIIDNSIGPEEQIINTEKEEELKVKINSLLSELEHKILVLFLQGYSYADIGKTVGKSIKSIDNAIQRIKKKVRPILLNGN